MRYLLDADLVIDAFIGIPQSVNILDRLSDEDLAISIVSYAE